MKRELTYSEAIREATLQLMQKYPEVYLLGEGVDDFGGVWGTTKGLVEQFGQERVVDIPLSENGLTAIAAGTSLLGFRPIFVHQRIDFMLMCMDALFNQATKWYYMTGLQKRIPLTVRAVIGKGWGQSVQHSQSFYPVFAHFPGVKVIAPFTPADAKGLLVSAALDDGPVIIIESRNLYNSKGDVPEEMYSIPIGKGQVLKQGNDLTIVGVSYALGDIMAAAALLEKDGLSVEVIDPRSIKPVDMELICGSVSKTRNLVVVDIATEHFNFTSEVSSNVTERLFGILQRAPLRLSLPDYFAGASESLERQYYLDPEKIYKKINSWWQAEHRS